MGLDWIVKTYKKNTYVDVMGDDSVDPDAEYMGVRCIRGKNIIRLLMAYVGDEEILDKCFGEFVIVDGKERGAFLEPSVLESIHDVHLYEVDLVEHEDLGTIEEQQDQITEVLSMYEDVMEFNKYSEDYVARIWAWY